MAPPDYTSFKALSFDVYGTLIDWESPLISLFAHHIGHGTPPVQEADIIRIFHSHERPLQKASPSTPYRDIATEATQLTSEELTKLTLQESPSSSSNISIADWPAFPDTVEAIQRLAKHYTLLALSNIDTPSFASTLAGPLHSIHFSGTYIASDIGSYKPSPANFAYLLSHAEAEFGVKADEILMVAHGLGSDHAPLKEAGMRPGVWIMRGEGEEALREWEGVEIGAKFGTLGEFADAVERAFERKEEKRGGEETLAVLEERGVGGS